MKCDPALIAELCSRPGAIVGGMGLGKGVDIGGGKMSGDHAAGRPVGRLPRRVGPNGEFKLELDFERKILVPKLYSGEIYSYKYEPKSFQLCDPAFGKATYKPDFIGVDEHGLVVWEVKGFMREAANVRLKVFADRHRQYRVFLCMRRKGKWDIQRIGRD